MKRPLAALVVLATGLAAACGPDRPTTWTEPVTGMEFLLVPAGTFKMGSPPDELGHTPGEILHEVTLTRPVWLARTEVTQAQWEKVMGENPSAHRGPDLPVENISADDAERFLIRLDELSPASGFRFPTEAEWERACRAGTSTPYSTGETLDTSQANFDGRFPMPGQPKGGFRGESAPVGSYPPNPWGFSDLHGNVWEWVADDICSYSREEAKVDPLLRCPSGRRVIRGGGWQFDADSARCGLRYSHRPTDVGPGLGLRVARNVDE